MEWRTRWHITIRWDRAENSPAGVTVLERVVDSTAELRRLVDRARADPHVSPSRIGGSASWSAASRTSA